MHMQAKAQIHVLTNKEILSDFLNDIGSLTV